MPIPEYIIGMDILKGMTLQLEDGKYNFAVAKLTFKIYPNIIVGKLIMPPLMLPTPTKVVHCRQYKIPGGHNEISETIQQYLNAEVMVPITTEWNNPIWPVRKSDGSW